MHPSSGGEMMGWSLGFDSHWDRDIGYGVPAWCDHPDCTVAIDRGLAYVCAEQMPYGGENGCGLYFCGQHHNALGKCERCQKNEPPFVPKPEHPDWIHHKATDSSWAEWRERKEEAV